MDRDLFPCRVHRFGISPDNAWLILVSAAAGGGVIVLSDRPSVRPLTSISREAKCLYLVAEFQ